jgi:hypothetical protein
MFLFRVSLETDFAAEQLVDVVDVMLHAGGRVEV